MNKKILICADDYAQNLEISQGILALVALGRMNAVSCLTNSPDWLMHADSLKAIQKPCLVGLHLNLTWGDALSHAWREHYGARMPKLSWLIGKTHLRGLKATSIHDELLAQLDAFVLGMGRLPDFIDGHQHVHQLPQIRDVLLHVYRQKHLNGFIRRTTENLLELFQSTGFPKRPLIAALGGMAFHRQLRQTLIPCNTSFSGIYDFGQNLAYRQRFRQFLMQSRDGGLIMCHPGYASNDETDDIRASRPYEFDYFASDAFLEDMTELGFTFLTDGHHD